MSPPINSPSSASELPTGVPGSIKDPAVERMARGAHNAVDRVAGTATSTVDRVRSEVDDVMGTVSHKMSALSSRREQWVDTCRERVREHPLATVGVALAAGYVLSRWMRS